mmetsp:Transcript_73506/g.204240  ORF Transcript_73506/g.204240 Transcript_73506/m.204240 type:complete len:335 (+) Transcript_73506:1-1005(+)
MGWGGWGKGGWGNGFGKGFVKGWGKQEKRSPPSIPEDFVVDTETRYKGTVDSYYKWQGYGFIKLDQAGVVPNDKIFVHWSNIQSNDRFPFLPNGYEVEFNILRWTEGWGANKTLTLRAKNVTAPGGSPIQVQDGIDAEKKTFVGAQTLRYSGKLKFYQPSRGFGYVTLDEGYKFDEPLPTDLRVEEAEMNCGGRRPTMRMVDLTVEFGIVKNRRGNFLAYNLTLPGGAVLSKENLEHRTTLEGQLYNGTVSFYNLRQGWGFITPSASQPLPPTVAAKLEQAVAEAKAKGKTIKQENALYFIKSDVLQGCKIAQDFEVTFELYTDDKGAGACKVH